MKAKKTASSALKKPSGVPKIGGTAPAFALEGTGGTKVRLSQFRGNQNVVVYFYPRDNTAGCTKEACAFRDSLAKLNLLETVVLGISTDSVASHEKFAAQYDLPFILLADEDAAVAKKYGVWVEKNLYGKKSYGVQRSTFLVDRRGKLAAVWPKVKVDRHVEAVLEAVRQLEA